MGNGERNYHILNFSFLLLILSIFTYSLIYKGNSHPIPALFTQVTGHIPPSKGLSESFSEIVRGNITDAIQINPHGLRIFFFFALQFFLRIFFSLVVRIKSNRIVALAIADSTLSIAIFILCFSPLIVYTLKFFLSVFV